MANETVLNFSGIGVAPYATRGARQSLTPIAQAGQLARTVNGVLVDLSRDQFRKYTSTIDCTDQKAPACDGVWPGQQITVDCIEELSYLTAGGSPERSVVSGSSYTDGSFTYYRPQLIMRVVSFEITSDEYAASVTWTMTLEEV